MVQNVDAAYTLLVNGFGKDNQDENLILDQEEREGNNAMDLAEMNEGHCNTLFRKQAVEVLMPDSATGLYKR